MVVHSVERGFKPEDFAWFYFEGQFGAKTFETNGQCDAQGPIAIWYSARRFTRRRALHQSWTLGVGAGHAGAGAKLPHMRFTEAEELMRACRVNALVVKDLTDQVTGVLQNFDINNE